MWAWIQNLTPKNRLETPVLRRLRLLLPKLPKWGRIRGGRAVRILDIKKAGLSAAMALGLITATAGQAGAFVIDGGIGGTIVGDTFHVGDVHRQGFKYITRGPHRR